MMNSTQGYLCYWGKTNKADDKNLEHYHLLAWHCLDVAACGYLIVRDNLFGAKEILNECGLKPDEAETWLAWLLACHDIGKFARGFQRYAAFPDTPLVNAIPGITASERHDTLGFYVWRKIREQWLAGKHNNLLPKVTGERKNYNTALDLWLSISLGHHGMPPDTTSKQCANAFDDSDLIAVSYYFEDLTSLFPLTLPDSWQKKEKVVIKTLRKHSWFFAGLATLADWMGSDTTFFAFVERPMALAEYWPLACEKAQRALQRLPVLSSVQPYLNHQTLFPFIQQLTPLQQRAAVLDITPAGPQMAILEDVTGAGKTEAALILTHRLLSSGKGKGIFVGLPTMATANAMYQRLATAYRGMFGDDTHPSLMLAHGGRHMSDAFRRSLWQPAALGEETYSAVDNSAAAECHAWFADSRKKALLAEVGVGTLDQLLMSVMPFRHQSLRLSGMRNKVLVLDEVHAYDGYMVKLLEGLLRFHAAQGGSAIILSATLPANLRENLLAAFNEGAGFDPVVPTDAPQYPWLSHLSAAGLHEYPIATRPEVQRSVAINWLHHPDDVFAIIQQKVAAGECVCWIRNTVDEACAAFQQLEEDGRILPENRLLFHSRFAFVDRMTIEAATLAWFGKSAPVESRQGKVLVATQVVEQSLDLDFDCMISDLAPVDLLIQRAGRLQRHIRDAQGRVKATLPDERLPPVLHILAPPWQDQPDADWLGETLRGSGFVYPDHACLWRTQGLLREFGEIRMPEGARQLVEGVYQPDVAIPEALRDSADTELGKRYCNRSVAAQNLLQHGKGYDRDATERSWGDEKVSTRLGEEGVELFLAWCGDDGVLQPVADCPEFGWEKSLCQVRLSWWQKHRAQFVCPDETVLALFRKQQHRPLAQVVLVSPEGEAAYYSKRLGFICETVKES
ncbi:MAG: CRISPR-associated helicase Cas3' [Yokenella regensburgei]|nr:CRISPR-associated helicase Cas3' [Yokenella regensburgei]